MRSREDDRSWGGKRTVHTHTHTRFDGVEVEVEGAWDQCVSVIDCFFSFSFLDTDGLAARPVCVVAAWGVGSDLSE